MTKNTLLKILLITQLIQLSIQGSYKLWGLNFDVPDYLTPWKQKTNLDNGNIATKNALLRDAEKFHYDFTKANEKRQKNEKASTKTKSVATTSYNNNNNMRTNKSSFIALNNDEMYEKYNNHNMKILNPNFSMQLPKSKSRPVLLDKTKSPSTNQQEEFLSNNVIIINNSEVEFIAQYPHNNHEYKHNRRPSDEDWSVLTGNVSQSSDKVGQYTVVKPPNLPVRKPTFELNGLASSFFNNNPDLEKLEFVYFNKKSKVRYNLNKIKYVLRHERFDETQKTIIYFYGHKDSIESENTKRIIKAYLEYKDYNVLVLDLKDTFDGFFSSSNFARLSKVAQKVATSILQLTKKGLTLKSIHLVGFGTGAHIAGNVGKAFKDLTDGSKQIERISGLDPSLFYFYPPIARHITADDAKFVDIIHSDAWGYGAPVSTGKVDFWPNGGRNQRGCAKRDYNPFNGDNKCSHYRSIHYWTESLENKYAFMALKCDSWNLFRTGSCRPKIMAYMGNGAKSGITGNFFLQTRDDSPFGRKHFGVIYET